MSDSNTHRPSRGDRWSLIAFIATSAVIVVATVAISVARIIEILGPGPIVVPVTFASFTAELPYGSSGQLPVAIDSGTITVAELPLASIVAGVLDPIVTVLIIATAAVCLSALSLSLLRGTIFSKRNTRLVSTAGIVGLVGFGAKKLFETMLANGAVAQATDRAYENLVMSFSPAPYLLSAFAIAMICTVFTIGERMQRDQEGLV